MEDRPTFAAFLEESPAFLTFLDNEQNFSSGNDKIIVSTYQLSKENPSLRTGSIYLLSSKGLSVKQKIETNGGVFRFEVLPNSSKIVASLTSGRVCIIDVKSYAQDCSGILSGGIVLNVSFNSEQEKLLCCDDYGELIVVDLAQFKMNKRWLAHKSKYGLALCEVWNCCWLKNNIAVSGAEDETVKIWDIRAEAQPQAVNKSHGSGIVYVSGVDDDENLLITGSYDEHLRLFDVRNFSHPVLEQKLNGGVWHVEKMAGDDMLYLCACMYGGWNVVSRTPFSFNTVHSSTAIEEGLLYGVSSQQVSDRKYRIATCTFNDKYVRLYDLKLDL